MFKAVIPEQNNEGVVMVKGIPFGDSNNRDIHNQFFTPQTNFLSHILPLPPVFHFHGAKTGSLSEEIGETISREQRDDGVWYKVKLFLNSQTEAVSTKASELWEAAKTGTLFGSSGAVEATIKVDDESGEILQWFVGELSLVDGKRQFPANFHATAIPVKANLEGVETGNVSISQLNFEEGGSNQDQYVDFENRLLEVVEKALNVRAKTEEGVTDMSEEAKTQADLIAQMQHQMAQMQQQVQELTASNTNLQSNIENRDAQISELQGVISTKSAEVAISSHVALVDSWINEGKITPAEKEAVLEVMSFAYQADATVKGDVGFVDAIKKWVGIRPANPVLGEPASIYNNSSSNLNGGIQGNGGGIDQRNIDRLKRYAEVS